MALRLPRFPALHAVPIPLLAAACGLVAGTTLVLLASQASPLLAAAVMAGLVVVGAVLLFPELGYLLTVFVIPLERVGRFTDDQTVHTLSVGRFVGILALGALLLHALIKKWQLRVGPAVALYAAYLGFGAITVFFSNDWEGGVRTGSQVAGILVFLFVVINFARNWRLAKISAVLWLAASLLAGLWTAFNWHFSLGETIVGEQNIGTTSQRFKATLQDDSPWDRLEGAVARAQGTTSHPAVYGINMIMTLPFWVYLVRVHRSPWIKVGASLSLLVCLYNIFLTNTRAAIALAAVMMALIAARGLIRLTPGRLVAGLVLATSTLYFVPSDVWVRVLDIGRYTVGQNIGTFALRLEFWDAALEGVKRNLLTGSGMGNQTVVPELTEGVSPKRISAHNEYLNTLLEVGLIGWILMFGAIFLLVRSSFRAARIFRGLPGRSEQYSFMVAAQLTMISVLLYGIQVDVFHFPLKGFWLVAGLSWSLEMLAREEARAFAASTAAAAPNRG
jgi:hypothetical protein